MGSLPSVPSSKKAAAPALPRTSMSLLRAILPGSLRASLAAMAALLLLWLLLAILPGYFLVASRSGTRGAGSSNQETQKIDMYHSNQEMQMELHFPPGKGYCLDGSLPGYYLRRGSGSGINSWIVYLRGGGWCFSWPSCLRRSREGRGSSDFERPGNDSVSSYVIRSSGDQELWKHGLLSPDITANPGFHNWNMVEVLYCDGASFLGQRGTASLDRENVLEFNGKEGLGQILRDLVANRSMNRAERALVAGGSAGGLAVAALCDWIVGHFNAAAQSRAKCYMEAGFFLDSVGKNGSHKFRDRMQAMDFLQRASLSAPAGCLRVHPEAPHLCLFPFHSIPHLKTPIFIYNTLYDYTALRLESPRRASKHRTIPGIWECLDAGLGCTRRERWRILARGSLLRRQVAALWRQHPSRVSFLLTRGASHDAHGAWTKRIGVYWSSSPSLRLRRKETLNPNGPLSAFSRGTTLQEALGLWYFNNPQL